jgi:preprotein translocase subunit SecD
MVLVDDELDWLAPHVGRTELPGRVDFLVENAAIGPGRVAARHYAHVPKDEVAPAVHAALEALVPPGHRLAWERTYERDDEDEDTYRPHGWRSYLLIGGAALDNRHIAGAKAQAEKTDFGTTWYVSLLFTEEGAAIFEDITRKNVKRRFAIVVDGVVTSAPVINEPITGGTARITMGGGTPEEQMRNARELERGLRAAMR